MFRIRKVTDDIYPMNKEAMGQVLDILRQRFPDIKEEKILLIPEQLRNPLKYQFRTILLVADNFNGKVMGLALLLHAPDLDFCYLDYLASRSKQQISGVGGALYERCREEASLLGSCGIFMECLPDDPSICNEETHLNQNAARLKFYERYGARPIANTLYETPVNPGDTCPPYLVLDPLDAASLPAAKKTRSIVNAILRRKYKDYCPEDYIQKVAASVTDDPVQLRAYKYLIHPKQTAVSGKTADTGLSLKTGEQAKTNGKIAITVNDRHSIHHVKEVGYVEAPVRISAILKSIENSGLFHTLEVKKFPEKHIREVHSNQLVDFLKQSETTYPKGNSVYPYVFPIRNANRKPKDVNVLPGYFCIDTFTPIHHNVWKAATGAVNCALSCANHLVANGGLTYALVRPPGHHAESNVFGGFCYLNSAAVAAGYLAKYGKVAILDIDYHIGNGQQEIFYRRSDVLTLSIHGNPSTTYPYFCGFKTEKGEGEGLGFNHNYPLNEGIEASEYRQTLANALKTISNYKPSWLVICLGLDTAKGDPTGSFYFSTKDFEKNGRMIGSLKIPTLVVQEGGYLTRTLGANAVNFFKGLHESFYPKKHNHLKLQNK
ncbi:MAG: histone deacetylase family protein [Bacteroidetes bacterium]|nr:MAG: histone deacetylase family protein [Bacteroidota bacterium]